MPAEPLPPENTAMAAWMARIAGRAAIEPARPRSALLLSLGGPRIGSLEPTLAHRLVEGGMPLSASGDGWHLTGPADASLAHIAQWLHAHGLGGRWRNELLAVTDDADRPVAAIERAAVRPLGITSFAVHLVGHTEAGEVWVQQRALDKATDPGQWDTLMGGLRAANESVHDTLQRETWEEAGLQVAALQQLQALGHLTVRRPVSEGYMVEHIDLFEAVVPTALSPVNQDGEVARFECLSLPALGRRLLEDHFTLEAALILAQWLQHRGLWVAPVSR